jgi:hypothetical protein
MYLRAIEPKYDRLISERIREQLQFEPAGRPGTENR